MKRIIPVLLGLSVFFSLAAPALAALPVEEADLNQNGQAYEINPDYEGWLWITDFYASEVWRVNPANGAYMVYAIPGFYTDPDDPLSTYGYPADARRVGNYFWWVDGDENLIGRSAVTDVDSDGDVAYTLWEVIDAFWFWGTTIDNTGRLWTADFYLSQFYSLEINAEGTPENLCVYTIPNSGIATFLAYVDPYLWIGDFITPRLVRLNVYTHIYEWYQLPYDSSPYGMAVDEQGDVWYADDLNSIIAELDPESHVLYRFFVPQYPIPQEESLPITSPQKVTIKQKQVWFSGIAEDSIGVLDSSTAAYTAEELPWGEGLLTPVCGTDGIQIFSSGDLPLTIPSSPLNFSSNTYTPLKDGEGWSIFDMPHDSYFMASPPGIAYKDGHIWMVDNGRQKLVEVDSPPNAADLTLTLTGTPATYDNVGDVINYTYLLTNSGSVELDAPFTVSATKENGEVSCPAASTLAVGNTITCTGSYTIAQADLDAGSAINIASAHAVAGTSPVASNLDSARTGAVQSPALTLVKTALQTTYSKAGDVIDYTFELTNSGNATLSAPFTITDDKALNENCPVAPTSLEPGQKITCTASYTITESDNTAGTVTNYATGHGFLGEIVVDSNQDSATVNYVPPPEYNVFLPLILR